MAVISGIGGHVEQADSVVNCVRTWGIAYNAGIQEAVCSATKGGRLRMIGNRDWSGQYTVYGSIPAVMPGASFKFDGAISGEGAAAIGVSGDAIVDSVTINWDMEAGTIINHQVSFGAMGELIFGAINAAADTVIPVPETAGGILLKSAKYPAGGVPGAMTQVNEVRTATLTLSRNNLSYVSSNTGGLTKRFQGNFDATLAFTCYAKDTDGWASFPQPNECHEFQVFTNATDYWLLKWMMIQELGGMDVDIESGALVGCSISAAMNGFWNPNGTWAAGVIEDPDSAQVWPTP